MMKPSVRLRRHHDDEYWDEITITAKYAGLGIHVVPRWKTSGLSGDEWRISTRMTLNNRQGPIYETTFNSMRFALSFAPHFVWQHGRELLTAVDATLVYMRKGHTLWSQQFPTFADAAFGVYYHGVVANEQSPGWHHLSDQEERQHCAQPGCNELPVCLYQLKNIMYGGSSGSRRTFMPPEYNFEAKHTWFCDKHKRRGDCGLEDADANYEVIIAAGSGIDPRTYKLPEGT